MNAFAIINDVAIQELLKDFNSTFFLEKESQIIKHNIEQIINETHFKKDKKLLFRLSEDLVSAFAQLFTNGNKDKALRQLDVRKTISQQNAVVISYFSGATTYAFFMLVVLFIVLSRTEFKREVMDDLYSFGSIFR